MKHKVCNGTEKYPSKRGYAIGKLQKFLKFSNLTKQFTENCKEQDSGKGHVNIEYSFSWGQSFEGPNFWSQVNKDFGHFLEGKKVFTVYGD